MSVAKNLSSIDNDAKKFEQETQLIITQKVNTTGKNLSDTDLYDLKTKNLVQLKDNDIPAKTKGDPMCVNGPCSHGGTWPNQQQVSQNTSGNLTAPPSASLLLIDQHQTTKANFIPGFNDQSMEFEDEVEKKDQDTQVKQVLAAITDAEDIERKFKTNAQLAKMDYQQFVEQEFGKLEQDQKQKAKAEEKAARQAAREAAKK